MKKENKVWFITGCSTGFGREIAKKAISAGYTVVATARNTLSLAELTRGSEERVLALQLDVTNQGQIKAAVNRTIERFGRIDVLVNNAGIGYFSSVEESIEEETRRMFEINFWGLMHVTNAVLAHMRSQKSGPIINKQEVFPVLIMIPRSAPPCRRKIHSTCSLVSLIWTGLRRCAPQKKRRAGYKLVSFVSYFREK